jgi:hypothetical protein
MFGLVNFDVDEKKFVCMQKKFESVTQSRVIIEISLLYIRELLLITGYELKKLKKSLENFV